MSDSTLATFVGLDVHKDSIAVAVLRAGTETPGRRTIANTPEAVRKLVAGWSNRDRARVCYEADPCGYALHRQLTGPGVFCEVIAPALIPRRPGVRIKTDKRDADSPARFYRAGELTAIRVPSEAVGCQCDCRNHRPDWQILGWTA